MCWMTSVQFPEWGGIFFFGTIPTLNLGPTHPAVLPEFGVFSPGVKQPGHTTDNTPSSSTMVKSTEPYLHPPMAL